ncbi:MAG: tetraacyldisaccharide 4'-kinase, partial [Epsilonproteobacteria bacterium]|nr:tetraacyldisaccharide 4'-kinase [Campylobacterota bacterium]
MLYRFIEKHFFSPSFASYLALLPLLPLSILYALIMFIRRKIAKQEEFPIPIISIGNLIVGGSGKTPFAIELAKKISPNYKIAYILRGYKRKSKGLIVVRDKEIKSTPKESGDEAYMAACELKDAIVIVSEDRKKSYFFAFGTMHFLDK